MEWTIVIIAVTVAAGLLARRALRHYRRSTAAGCPSDGCPMGCSECAPGAKIASDIDSAMAARRRLPDQAHAQGK
jgi:hypothetical protein